MIWTSSGVNVAGSTAPLKSTWSRSEVVAVLGAGLRSWTTRGPLWTVALPGSLVSRMANAPRPNVVATSRFSPVSSCGSPNFGDVGSVTRLPSDRSRWVTSVCGRYPPLTAAPSRVWVVVSTSGKYDHVPVNVASTSRSLNTPPSPAA